jgi:hypothetical protein
VHSCDPLRWRRPAPSRSRPHGFRAIGSRSGRTAQLWSRNQKDFTRRFPAYLDPEEARAMAIFAAVRPSPQRPSVRSGRLANGHRVIRNFSNCRCGARIAGAKTRGIDAALAFVGSSVSRLNQEPQQ